MINAPEQANEKEQGGIMAISNSPIRISNSEIQTFKDCRRPTLVVIVLPSPTT
jgi:hypothetical protein